VRYSFILFLSLLFYIDTAVAYVGPGLGLGAIGAFVGVIVTILLAIIGVIWYPLKRVLRRNSSTADYGEESDES
jgi:hypothetical protein